MQYSADVLNELVRRIVEAVHPLRIILFGSAARGDTNPYSDIDVMVVMPDGTHRRKTEQMIARHVFGIGVAVDIIVATPTDLKLYQDTPWLIYQEIMKEGKELYAA